MDNNKRFLDPRLGVYCCGHLFRRERPALLIGRQDGDWQFMCGKTDHSDPKEPYHVSVGVLLDVDQSLHEISDLPEEWEAERNRIGAEWIRTRCDSQDA